MFITQTLGGEIKDYVVSLLGHDSKIIGPDGFCISSSNPQEVGTKADIDKSSLYNDKPSHVRCGDGECLLIPLFYQHEKVAFLLLNQTDRMEIEKYIPLIESFAELLIQQYYENNKPVLDSTDQFIIKLINNASTNDLPFYESEAKSLGYDLTADRVAVVVHLEGFWDNCLLSIDQPSFERDQVIHNYKRKIETAINGFFSRNSDIIIAYIGNDKFVVFKAVDKSDQSAVVKFLRKSYKAIFEPLKNCRITSYAVGYSNAYSGIQGLVTAFKEADLSIELGKKLWGQDQSYYFGDLGLMSIIGQGSKEKNLDFANQLLSKMDDNEDLNQTLECFFDQNLNLTETAEKLGVHRNTIIYRLNQISKILDADPRIFEQAMTIKIALLIRKLFV